jgi:hypothetical protein
MGVNLDQYRESLIDIVAERDLITTDGYKSIADKSGRLLYYKRDFLFRSGDWRGNRIDALLRHPRAVRGKHLVVGHSDRLTTPLQQRLLRSYGVTSLIGTNVTPVANFSASVPLGLTNDCDDTPLHRILGDTRLLEQASQHTDWPGQYRGTVFGSFNPDTAPQYRRQLAGIFSGRNDFFWADPEYTAKGRVQFLASLRKHTFVLCPRGNGMDTHRLWETLYMGGLPVVRTGEFVPSLIENLPVLAVQSWQDLVDPSRRRDLYEDVMSGSWDPSTLRQSSWGVRLSAL